jgi:hypothetical protein
MNEADARKKWCPMARLITITHRREQAALTSFNRMQYSDKDEVLFLRGHLCIASECMLWKQEEGCCGLASSEVYE